VKALKPHALVGFVLFRGKFLDAGTGTHSLKWINTLDTESFTAVTADPQFADTTRKEVRGTFYRIRGAIPVLATSAPS